MRIAACMAIVAVLAGGAAAQVSVWSAQGGENGQEGPNPFLTRPVSARAFKVHDIVNVIINVTAETFTAQEADLEKKASPKLDINNYIKLQDGSLKGRAPDNLSFDVNARNKYENEASNTRKEGFRTRVSAEIIDIKPNGNLVIQARHRFARQEETTVITLTGTVRPQDVLPDNVILSQCIADADIRYETTGPVSRAAKRGWFARILDAVWPF